MNSTSELELIFPIVRTAATEIGRIYIMALPNNIVITVTETSPEGAQISIRRS